MAVKRDTCFHLHNHQWRLESENPSSTIIDSVSISPQECYTLDILHGAGSLNGMIEMLFFTATSIPIFMRECGPYGEFMTGWKTETAGCRTERLSPLCFPLRDRVSPQVKDAQHPGYPRFINGEFGERPPQPPLGIPDKRRRK